MSNEPSYTIYATDTYAFAPFYRISYCHYVTKPATTCQTILFHTYGAVLYIALHMLSSVFIYISTQSFNFAITVGLLYLCVTIVRHSKLGNGIYIVDVETGVDPTIHADNGHNGYDIAPRSNSYTGTNDGTESETETEKEESETSCEGESISPPSTDPDIREETPPETEESGNESPLKED